MEWKKDFEDGKEIVLCTCTDNKPNANIVVSLGFVGRKLLIANCQMKTTIENIKSNPRVCIVGGYFRAKGRAGIEEDGKYLEIARTKTREYEAFSAVVVDVEEVFDLDKGRIVKKAREVH